jgi:SAM-dependent methyltransferase
MNSSSASSPVTSPISNAHWDANQNVLQALNDVAQETDPRRLRRLVQPLANAVDEFRRAAGEERWKQTVHALRQHPAFARIQLDPYTNRAFTKPRGYAGDAVMLDYIYRPAFTAAPALGHWQASAIYSYTSAGPATRAVINRRTLLARTIDTVDGDRLRIASLACGHLREAELMHSLASGRIETFYALDQDQLSIAECEEAFDGTAVRPMVAGVIDLLRGRLPEVCELNYFYAAGLFDYLNDKIAEKLVTEMFRRLAPGGKMLIANFTPETRDRGYMEAFMDWWLIYRNEQEMETLTGHLDPEKVASRRTFREAESNIVFLEITRV